MRVVLNFLAATFLVLVARPAPAESAADMVEAGTVTFVEAFNSSDGNRMVALYTQDAVLLPPAAPLITGCEDTANFWQGAMDSGLSLAQTEPLEVIESGGLAVDTGVIYLNVPDGSGGMVEVAMKYVVAWQKG